ncbi:VWA domain-containing protein [Candidatus Woesearchaeota archaeon]|nr:VWA domain-containing protein [Candidatus Woesearchaeota archaeon]MCF8013443.1 VWA domain-containing protein [Candidatus Woesearchaeota archaeon]
MIKKTKNKKSIYFSLDGILAGILIASVLIMLLQNNFYEPKIDQKSFMSQDILNSLTEIKLHEINNQFILDEITNGNITDTNRSVLVQLGEYWALNKTDKAQQLFESVLNLNTTNTKKIRLTIENEEIYSSNQQNPENIVSTPRMIAGIAKGSPIEGFSSNAYLKKISDKKTSSFSYIGGFIGQGNITNKIILPEDYTQNKFIQGTIKLETPGEFEIYINGDKCGTTYQGTDNVVKEWSLNECNSSLNTNTNKIKIIFISELNESYISGGLIKITYTTDKLIENYTQGYKKIYFPEIEGFVNIYDSISAQGKIQNYTLNMTFFSQYDTFFTFGNETLFIAPGDNQTQNVLLTKLNQNLDPKQIPIRFGITNFSNISIIQDGLPADSLLVTDVSGSMGNCGEYASEEQELCTYEYYQWWSWGYWAECQYTGSCNDNECGVWAWYGNTRNHEITTENVTLCNRTLMDVAKDSDQMFVQTILENSTINKIGLVDYSTNANTETSLTNNQGVLLSEIETYSASGSTCTCCGINKAASLLYGSENKKFMVVLSDGEPSLYCNSFTDYQGSNYWGGDSSSGSSSSTDKQWAIDAGQEACNNNITVYSIGFGEAMSSEGHDVMRQIACNDSLYYNATNVQELAQIYQNISNQILISANFSSQTLSIIGDYLETNISDESYIELFYEPLIEENLQNKISLTFETEQLLNCSSTIDIPSGITIKDAHITSYSSNHWSKYLEVNGIEVFNLTKFGTNYSILGDPFIIQIPSTILLSGKQNNITLNIGDNAYNNSNCSQNNTIIYTALLNSSTERMNAKSKAEGCSWTIESENNKTSIAKIPADYNGTKNCTYNSTTIYYDPEDSYDLAAYNLMQILDPDNNQKIIVELQSTDLEIIITTIEGVPYLWGPSLIKIEIS